MTSSHGFPLFISEGKVQTHEVAVAALVLASPGCPRGSESRELLMPGKTGAAVHERVVAVPKRERVDVSQIGWVTGQGLLRHSH